jgi:hypothetical protein
MQMSVFRRYSVRMLLFLDVYRNHHEPPVTDASLGTDMVREALHLLGLATKDRHFHAAVVPAHTSNV